MKKTYYLLLLLSICLFVTTEAHAQNTELTSDELLMAAKKASSEKNYPQAIALLKQGLKQSPDYVDLMTYLGRIYTYSDKLDSARYQINQALAKSPKNVEALEANFDLEYWNNNYNKALDHANMGLLYHPDSSTFVIRKAKALNALKDPRLANEFLKDYLKNNPTKEDVTTYFGDLRKANTKNALDVSYEYVYFDKRFDDPWHYASVDYTRNTSIGSVTARLNYANRFKTNGYQYEIEAYPTITKNIYAYVAGAYSNSDIFPVVRFGTSLYYTLPKSFDFETGIRYLNFDPTETYIFVLAAGKYIGNYYFNLKAYISPDVEDFSHSYTLSARYYFSDRFNFIGAQVGTGVSPDDRARNITGIGNLKSYKAGINFSRDLVKNFTLSLSGLWFYEEYATASWGNQISGGITLSRRF